MKKYAVAKSGLPSAVENRSAVQRLRTSSEQHEGVLLTVEIPSDEDDGAEVGACLKFPPSDNNAQSIGLYFVLNGGSQSGEEEVKSWLHERLGVDMPSDLQIGYEERSCFAHCSFREFLGESTFSITRTVSVPAAVKKAPGFEDRYNVSFIVHEYRLVMLRVFPNMEAFEHFWTELEHLDSIWGKPWE